MTQTQSLINPGLVVVYNDIVATWYELLLLSGVALLVSLCITIFMRFFAAVIIWTMYIFSGLGSLAGTAYCWYKWYDLKTTLDEIAVASQLDSDKELVKNWIIYAGVVTGLTVVLLLLLLVMRKRIALVVVLFSEAGKAIGKMPLILFQPLWTMILLVGVIAGIGYGSLYVFSAGYATIDEDTGFVFYKLDEILFYFRWYYLFGVLWVIQFIFSSQQMVISGAVSAWYFTRNKKDLNCCKSCFVMKSIWNLVRYHLGTVAVGSFIIALLQFIRIILMFLQRKLQARTNKIAQMILKCLMCCFWVLEKLLKYINKNAYIITSMYGHSFCRAAHRAFTLLVANILRVGAINSVGTFTLVLGQVGIVAIVIIIGMQFIQPNNGLCLWFVPLVVSGLVALYISYCFLNVYGMAIDTIFLCFCEDSEKNDGGVKPYYMSVALMKFVENSGTAMANLKRTKGAAKGDDAAQPLKGKPKGPRKHTTKVQPVGAKGRKGGGSKMTDVAW